jgi:uncharacterized protein (TIGR02453 family)
MGGFTGFGPKALPFFKALKFHQSREWFQENRALYEGDVVEPMMALLEDLSQGFAKSRIPLRADGKKSIFRINRDVRFSKNKSPYKTHCGAVMTRSGAKGDNGLVYIHIDPEGCFAAAGFYRPEPADLNRLRKAIASKPAAASSLLAALKKGKLALRSSNQLTRVPKGFETLKGGPLDEVIRLKYFIVEEAFDAKSIASPKFADSVADFAKRALPLLKFGWTVLD